MFKLFHKIFSLILVIVILTTTTGFRVYSHECDCCGTEEISLVEIQECCVDSHEAMICNISHQQVSACCTAPEPSGHDCAQSECCEVDSDFHKLNQLFEKSNVLTINYPRLENFSIQIINTEPLVEQAITGFLDTSENAPPKIPIRDFVIFSHALKIDC